MKYCSLHFNFLIPEFFADDHVPAHWRPPSEISKRKIRNIVPIHGGGGGCGQGEGIKKGKIVELAQQVTYPMKVVLVVYSRSRALILGLNQRRKNTKFI